MKVTQRADVISFAGGLPAPELLRLPEVRAAVDRVLTDNGAALQYSTTEGHLPSRKRIARQNRLTPDRLQITSGIQQGLDLLGQVLIDPGDVVLVEQPTYLGALQAFGSYQPRFAEAVGQVAERVAEPLRVDRAPRAPAGQPQRPGAGGQGAARVHEAAGGEGVELRRVEAARAHQLGGCRVERGGRVQAGSAGGEDRQQRVLGRARHLIEHSLGHDGRDGRQGGGQDRRGTAVVAAGEGNALAGDGGRVGESPRMASGRLLAWKPTSASRLCASRSARPKSSSV